MCEIEKRYGLIVLHFPVPEVCRVCMLTDFVRNQYENGKS